VVEGEPKPIQSRVQRVRGGKHLLNLERVHVAAVSYAVFFLVDVLSEALDGEGHG
jgi:hypothetical protein